MAEPYLGEIRMFGGSYAPNGWALCNGQFMNISQNSALFSLIGTIYGGDGQTTFALPDLRGRVPLHAGTLNGISHYAQGQMAGVESVTLTVNQMPQHTHTVITESTAGADTPAGNTWAVQPQSAYTTPLNNLTSMSASAVSVAGGSFPHTNLMPSLTVSFIIALEGIFPPRE